jgi:hypothetical protein
MTLALIFSPEFDAAAFDRALPAPTPGDALHLVEAWPGSITAAEGDKAEGWPDVLVGYVLAAAGELPEDVAGVLIVLAPGEVAAVRSRQEKDTSDRLRLGRIEQRPHEGWHPPWIDLHLPPRMPTTCHIVEQRPGSVHVYPGGDGGCTAISGWMYSVEGSHPAGIVGCPLMLHLASCALRQGGIDCDCHSSD